MGLLDDAIREHLDLKRRRGADPTEVERQEREALGPARRGPEPEAIDPLMASSLPRFAAADDEPHPSDAELREHAERFDEEFDEPPFNEPPFDEAPFADEHDVQPVSFKPRSLRERLLRRPAQHDEEDWDEPLPEDEGLVRDSVQRVPRTEPVDPVPFVAGDVEHSGGAGAYERPVVDHLDQPTEEYDALEHAEARGEAPERAGRAAGHDDPFADDPVAGHGDPVVGHGDPVVGHGEPVVGHGEPVAGHPSGAHAEPHAAGGAEDPLEETPDFLHDTPEHDRLWFEQRPPKDFDFDG